MAQNRFDYAHTDSKVFVYEKNGHIPFMTFTKASKTAPLRCGKLSFRTREALIQHCERAIMPPSGF